MTSRRAKHQLQREQWVPKSVEAAFAFFSRPENLQAITPAWLDFQLVSVPVELCRGALIRYRLRWHGLPLSWTTEIAAWEAPFRFIDTQISGPYALWHHEHSFAPENDGTRILDEVTYVLPFGFLGQLAYLALVRQDVEKIFDYRQQRLRVLLGT